MDKSNQVPYNTLNNGDEPMSEPVIGKISDDDYQKILNALDELEKYHEEHQKPLNDILNNPISRVLQTRTVWNKQLEISVTECLVSFDDEEPAWIPLRTIQGIYAYLTKTFNSIQI